MSFLSRISIHRRKFRFSHFLIIFFFVTLILWLCVFLFSSLSVSTWEKMSLDYLSGIYSGDFQAIDHSTVGDITTFTFQTADEQGVVFNVDCWIDGTYTPWGNLPLFQERHFSDNFVESLAAFVIGESPVDLSGFSVDEVIEYFKEKSAEISLFYEKYGIGWQTPNFQTEICVNGSCSVVRYMGQDDSIFRDFLFREFFQ